jgi:hypothetical protein
MFIFSLTSADNSGLVAVKGLKTDLQREDCAICERPARKR